MVVSYSKWVLGIELKSSAVSTPNSWAILPAMFFFFKESFLFLTSMCVFVHVCHGTNVEITTLGTFARVHPCSVSAVPTDPRWVDPCFMTTLHILWRCALLTVSASSTPTLIILTVILLLLHHVLTSTENAIKYLCVKRKTDIAKGVLFMWRSFCQPPRWEDDRHVPLWLISSWLVVWPLFSQECSNVVSLQPFQWM